MIPQGRRRCARIGDLKPEVEIKLKIASAAQGRILLRHGGFEVVTKRHLERNFVLDTAKGSLRRMGKLLRLRNSGEAVTLTFKGKSQPGKHKTREEIEFEVPDFDRAALLLERLGYQATFRYEKYRTVYARPRQHGHAMLDETPIGVYLELEGSPGWIDRMARRLGFGEGDYITASYGSLYAAHCKRADKPLGDFVFARQPTKGKA